MRRLGGYLSASSRQGSAFFGRLGIVSAILAAFVAPALSANAVRKPIMSQRAPEIRLKGERVTLPIVVVRGYPFVEGSIAGETGKLMLDTGAEQALTINDHRVPVSGGRTIGTGHFGSGQSFVTRLVPEVRDIRIGKLAFPRATNVQTQDARQLEAITPDFIGWVGYDAWAGYALKLDYRHRRAIFYKGGPATYLNGEKVIAELPFETRKLPNQPLMAAQIGDMPVLGAWDTGQYGTLFTSAAGKALLLREKRLTVSRNKPDAFDLNGLKLDGHSLPSILGIDVETTPFPAAAPIGIRERDVLTIAFGFLRQYKTVWDYQRHRIYVLAP